MATTRRQYGSRVGWCAEGRLGWEGVLWQEVTVMVDVVRVAQEEEDMSQVKIWVGGAANNPGCRSDMSPTFQS